MNNMMTFTNLAIFIVLLLISGSFFINHQKKAKDDPERIKNQQRLFVWWQIFALCTVVFGFGGIVLLGFVIALLYWVLNEVFGLFDVLDKTLKRITVSHIIIIFCGFAFVFSYLLVQSDHLSKISGVIFSIAILFAGISYWVPIKDKSYLPVFCTHVTLSLISITLIAAHAEASKYDYSYLLLVLFFVTSLNDIAQYVFGKMFGRRLFTKAIAPTLSPNKTVEGLWGGILVSSIVCSVLLSAFLSISIIEAFCLGSMLSLAGFLGDLSVSKIKRGLGVKDSGNSITGHGGILDRIDSLLLTAPVFGLYLYLFIY